jgi:hypothetical protein
MCPACISTMVLAIAGAIATGTAGTFVAQRWASIAGRGKPNHPTSKETVRHDY